MMPPIPRLEPHPPGQRRRLTDALAEPPAGLLQGKAMAAAIDALEDQLQDLQAALGAEARRAVLAVLQGRDTCGKDGTVRRVFGALNPASCTVTGFRKPSPVELAHDYLWRVHQAVPGRGSVGVFNRSHYEDVLVVRVHGLMPEEVWGRRFDHINQFERMLTDEGVVVRKFFLHISKEEQRRRLEERLADPTKNWKFEAGDLAERARWDRYTEAYEEMLERTSTVVAPWFVVPADDKVARNYLVAEAMVRTLQQMAPRFPPASPETLAWRGRVP